MRTILSVCMYLSNYILTWTTSRCKRQWNSQKSVFYPYRLQLHIRYYAFTFIVYSSLSRRQVMYANTLFMCVCFEPLGCQLLTGGTDRRVAYWEAGSGNLAREVLSSMARKYVIPSQKSNRVETLGGQKITSRWPVRDSWHR